MLISSLVTQGWSQNFSDGNKTRLRRLRFRRSGELHIIYVLCYEKSVPGTTMNKTTDLSSNKPVERIGEKIPFKNNLGTYIAKRSGSAIT